MTCSPARFGPIAITLHWLIAALVVISVASGLVTSNTDDATLTRESLNIHQSIGLVVVILAVIRAVWRLAHPAPPLPEGTSLAQRIAAGITHMMLYLILLASPMTGYVSLAARGRAVSFFGLADVPNVTPLNFQLASRFHTIHEQAEYVLYALLAVHIGAALYHKFVLDDGILERMWPRRRRV